MLRSPLVYAALAGSCLAALGTALGAGCSKTTTTETPAGPLNLPPGPPANGAMGDGPGATFAVSKLYLGDTSRKGQMCSPTCWGDFGYDLDGQAFAQPDASRHCKLNAGATPALMVDGPGGVDNSFGKNLLPIILTLGQSFAGSSTINADIAAGKFTLLVKIDKLGSQANYIGLNAGLFVGTNLGHPASATGGDSWPIAPESLQCANPMMCTQADLANPLLHFQSSFVNNNVWADGTPGTLTLSLAFGGTTFDLQIAQAVITMQLSADRKSATNGVIAGILPVEQLISEIKKIAGRFSKSLCNGDTINSIVGEIRQFADIGADGTQNPGKTCDGISIGLGFDAVNASLGMVAPQAPPPPDPCAGTGGAGGGAASSATGGGATATSSGTTSTGAGGAGGAKM